MAPDYAGPHGPQWLVSRGAVRSLEAPGGILPPQPWQHMFGAQSQVVGVLRAKSSFAT
jgi:hypothetical protein